MKISKRITTPINKFGFGENHVLKCDTIKKCRQKKKKMIAKQKELDHINMYLYISEPTLFQMIQRYAYLCWHEKF